MYATHRRHNHMETSDGNYITGAMRPVRAESTGGKVRYRVPAGGSQLARHARWPLDVSYARLGADRPVCAPIRLSAQCIWAPDRVTGQRTCLCICAPTEANAQWRCRCIDGSTFGNITLEIITQSFRWHVCRSTCLTFRRHNGVRCTCAFAAPEEDKRLERSTTRRLALGLTSV